MRYGRQHPRRFAIIEEGDKEGNVDQGRLSIALYQVGGCLSGIGKFDEAVPGTSVLWTPQGSRMLKEKWIMKAGRCLHQIGYCLAKSGKMNEAREWYERAANAKEKGDGQGHINFESLAQAWARSVTACFAPEGSLRHAPGTSGAGPVA